MGTRVRGRNILYKGKTKAEITDEAFERLGADATRPQVNDYFKKEYGITKPIEKSMFYTARARLRSNKTAPTNRISSNGTAHKPAQAAKTKVATASEVNRTELLRNYFRTNGISSTNEEAKKYLVSQGLIASRRLINEVRQRVADSAKKGTTVKATPAGQQTQTNAVSNTIQLVRNLQKLARTAPETFNLVEQTTQLAEIAGPTAFKEAMAFVKELQSEKK